MENLIDHLFDVWNRKPFGLVTAGRPWGGVRYADMLRKIVAGLQGVTIPRHVPVPHVSGTFTEDGPVPDRPEWERRFDRFFDHIEWYARALKIARWEPPSS